MVDKEEYIAEKWVRQDNKLIKDQQKAHNLMQHTLEEQGHKRVRVGRRGHGKCTRCSLTALPEREIWSRRTCIVYNPYDVRYGGKPKVKKFNFDEHNGLPANICSFTQNWQQMHPNGDIVKQPNSSHTLSSKWIRTGLEQWTKHDSSSALRER